MCFFSSYPLPLFWIVCSVRMNVILASHSVQKQLAVGGSGAGELILAELCGRQLMGGSAKVCQGRVDRSLPSRGGKGFLQQGDKRQERLRGLSFELHKNLGFGLCWCLFCPLLAAPQACTLGTMKKDPAKVPAEPSHQIGSYVFQVFRSYLKTVVTWMKSVFTFIPYLVTGSELRPLLTLSYLNPYSNP